MHSSAIAVSTFLPLLGCGAAVPAPTTPSPAQSFLTGTWRGTMTIQPDPTGPQPGARQRRCDLDVRGGAADEPADLPRDHPLGERWLPITLTSSTSIIPGNTPPAQISTQGDYDSPRGCRGPSAASRPLTPAASTATSPASIAPPVHRVVAHEELRRSPRSTRMRPFDSCVRLRAARLDRHLPEVLWHGAVVQRIGPVSRPSATAFRRGFGP